MTKRNTKLSKRFQTSYREVCHLRNIHKNPRCEEKVKLELTELKYRSWSSYRLVQFFVVFEKFTCAYLFQIALEIIWLSIQRAVQQRAQNNA